MKNLKGNEIREMWLSFWESKGHERIKSSSLIPTDDPTLLWINAGITPLKKYFDGSVVPTNRRITNSQKCLRTNDIDNVGRTARHHTFFEMLGNFSIGDYFKEDAIKWGFELLTSPKYFAFDVDKLYMTVYPSDNVAKETWLSLGIKEDHIVPIEDNFWQIGDGPCGPDSEIFYDRGLEYDKDNVGIKLLEEDIENDRYIEIYNIVFSQYNGKTGVARDEYEELPNRNIDTGMGLERVACVMEEAETNYETSLFIPIMKKIEEITNVKYTGQMSFKVIADHIRTLAFTLTDGASFSNSGRGYVLRRLLRRSVVHGKRLGITKLFLSNIVDTVADLMVEVYPNVKNNSELIKQLINDEEVLFRKTLLSGEKRLLELIEACKLNKQDKFSGEEAFKLYDTYGFPYELTKEYVEETKLFISKDEFDKFMQEQKDRARSARKDNNSMAGQNEKLLNFKTESTFVGYDKLETTSKIVSLYNGDTFVDNLNKEGVIITEQTPFYAESGGQVADLGTIEGDSFKATVKDVFKAPNGQHMHVVEVIDGSCSINDSCTLKIDINRRNMIAANHSSVHILQKALQIVVNSNIKQAGSKVSDSFFRFDFTSPKKITDNDLIEIEKTMNSVLIDSTFIETKEMSKDEAVKDSAMALFDEKYGGIVRVVTIGNSKELCGGTHIKNISEINKIGIVSIESKGSNVYRIVGSTNNNINSLLLIEAKNTAREIELLTNKANKIITSAKNEGIILTFNVDDFGKDLESFNDLLDYRLYMKKIAEKLYKLEQRYLELQTDAAMNNLDAFSDNIQEINGVKILIMEVSNYNVSVLKDIMGTLLDQMNPGLIFIANKNSKAVNFFAKISPTVTDKVNAGTLVRMASLKAEGNGGGSKSFAQGGGTKLEATEEILSDIKEEVVKVFNN